MTSSTTPTTTRRQGWGRRALVAVAIFAVLAIVAYLLVGLLVYDQLSAIKAGCNQQHAANTPSSFQADKDDHEDTTPYLMPEYETVTLPSRDPGVQIAAWYVPAGPPAQTPAVVLVHGHDSCRREGRMLLAAGMLHKAGIAALLIDMRNHGDSTVVNGRYAGGTREYADALGGWDWLVARGHPATRTGALGMSLGAATALIATGEEPRVAAVWEDSSYADVDEAVAAELTRNDYPTWLRYGGYLVAQVVSGDDLLARSPVGEVGMLHGRPIAITHGSADERLSVTYASELADAVRASGGSVDPWIVDNAHHTQAIALHPAEYERRLDAFFRAALAAK
jgi:dipeptidyl aminopeptidase/acylaminoacyl peptidase